MASRPDQSRTIAALRFRALGDETRLRILREAGLVIDRRDGRWIHYSIAEPALAACRLALYEMEPLRGR